MRTKRAADWTTARAAECESCSFLFHGPWMRNLMVFATVSWKKICGGMKKITYSCSFFVILIGKELFGIFGVSWLFCLEKWFNFVFFSLKFWS